MTGLPVYERFHSWQGEGAHLGKSAFFIRLHGCPIHCSWCDSAGTWHPDHRPESVDHMDPQELADEAFLSCPEMDKKIGPKISRGPSPDPSGPPRTCPESPQTDPKSTPRLA